MIVSCCNSNARKDKDKECQAHPQSFGDTKQRRGREIIKRLVLGPAAFPHQCAVGLSVPQSEISVWLHGVGAPREMSPVKRIAGTQPLVIELAWTAE